MRVATAHSYDSTISNLNKRQAGLVELQERISTGKRVLRASDDPVAAVLAESAQNKLSRVAADQRALEHSRTSITQAESALGEAGSLVQDIREVLVGAGNATYGSKEYTNLAQKLEGLRDQLIGVANQRDGAGRTLFGGLGGSSTPFVEVYGPSGSTVRFDGQRGQDAGGDNTLPLALDGEAVFLKVPPGNGSFTIDLGATNTGSVRADTGRVSNPSAVTGHDYTISFADVAGVMAYSVTDTTTGSTVASAPYTPGATLEFDGIAFQVSGAPASGDSLDVKAVTTSTDLFQVVQNAIDALKGATTGQSASLVHTLGRAITELDAGHDRVLAARSQTGAWLNRADRIDSLLSHRELAQKSEKSDLEDLDMVQGISDFQNQQTGLQAAMTAYAQVQKMSLFQYVS